MTLATTAYTFGGVSLQNGRTWNVKLLSPTETLERRGENIVIPGLSGQTVAPKVLEQRKLSLAMVVTGELPGKSPSGEVLAANLDTLLRLFQTDGPQTLTRRRGARIESASAECVNVNVVPAGPTHAHLLVDLLLADPLWYAPLSTTSGAFSSLPFSLAVVNSGTYQVERMVLTVTCPTSPSTNLLNPKFTIGSTWVKYTGDVLAGTSLQIDVGAFTATAGGASVISAVTWSELTTRWLVAPVGAFTVAVTGDGISNTPTLYVTFYPAYL